MPLLTRRRALLAGAGLAAGTAAEAVAIEPGFRLVVQEYRVSLPGWGERPPLSICMTADVHAGEPWMPLGRVERIVATANALRPDLHVMLGDLPAHHRFVTKRVPMEDVVRVLSGLEAPLGRFAVLGNHDWWDDEVAMRRRRGPPLIGRLLEQAGLAVLTNRAVRLPHGEGVWLGGVDSARAFGNNWGAGDVNAAMAPMAGDALPAILLAHEPDLFAGLPARFALTLSGHTHGGQVRVLGHSPMVPSAYGNRYAYGLVRERGRQLVVSGGLGCSLLPVRLGVPPELTMVRIG